MDLTCKLSICCDFIHSTFRLLIRVSLKDKHESSHLENIVCQKLNLPNHFKVHLQAFFSPQSNWANPTAADEDCDMAESLGKSWEVDPELGFVGQTTTFKVKNEFSSLNTVVFTSSVSHQIVLCLSLRPWVLCSAVNHLSERVEEEVEKRRGDGERWKAVIFHLHAASLHREIRHQQRSRSYMELQSSSPVRWPTSPKH